MTSVLTAFRSNEEKVAAAVAECRRLGIAVLPPDVHASHLEFTVEGDAIRFGLLAVKNVGQGAIESIIAARDEGGDFRSLTDFCTRIDLRLCNRKVLEALIKVGALSSIGHPAQLLLGLDDAIGSAQATQRDRVTGQTSLFDLGAADADVFERPLPAATEVPMRERLRWEKELLGLYLSEHPMGEVAEQVGRFVNAYSGDLKDESLDGQRVVVGGIVTGVRTVVTKRNETMAIVTLEDLQGTVEVVVFPRLYETTRPTWRDGSILLVAGRVDHRGEEMSLLADLAVDWDDAVARGPEAFAAEVAAGDRGPRGRGGPGGRPRRQRGQRERQRYGPGRAADGAGRPGRPEPGAGRGRWRGAGPAGRPVRVAASRGRRRRREHDARRHCRRSRRPSRSRPTRRRTGRRSPRPTTTRSRPCRTRREPTRSRPRRRRPHHSTSGPGGSCTSGSSAPPRSGSSRRCGPSGRSSVSGRARRVSSSTSMSRVAAACRSS